MYEWWKHLTGALSQRWERLIPNACCREWIETLVWAVALALLLRAFVIQAFWIPSSSMVPTLLEGDRVLVCKFRYMKVGDWQPWPPKRGDVFVFKYPKDPSTDFVKRLIALPGDKFEIRNGVVWINDQKTDEPYVRFHDTYNCAPLIVPEKSYVALGDNRPNSADSRYWGFVPEENIRGPVFLRYWPLNRIGLVR